MKIGLAYDPKTFELYQPVEFYLYPQCLRARSTVTGEHIPFPATQAEQLKRVKAFIDKGLRVQLRTSSLLTGQKYLAIDMFPDAPTREAAQRAYDVLYSDKTSRNKAQLEQVEEFLSLPENAAYLESAPTPTEFMKRMGEVG